MCQKSYGKKTNRDEKKNIQKKNLILQLLCDFTKHLWYGKSSVEVLKWMNGSAFGSFEDRAAQPSTHPRQTQKLPPTQNPSRTVHELALVHQQVWLREPKAAALRFRPNAANKRSPIGCKQTGTRSLLLGSFSSPSLSHFFYFRLTNPETVRQGSSCTPWTLQVVWKIKTKPTSPRFMKSGQEV